MPSALKLSDDIVASARQEGRASSRSATQQVEHWARVGRVVERLGVLDSRRVRAALRAELGFDDLSGRERAVVLAELDRAVFRPEGDRGVAEELARSRVARSELDARGRVVVLPPRETVLSVPGRAARAAPVARAAKKKAGRGKARGRLRVQKR